ncbi:hypothetical protein OE88DRAFT_1720946 [Heliocybe sulcata]|uniref:BTB domain-containing protein n=1 Tax=Heliocybe sulcata TaxID=5364 RepID=A0A5C3MPR1_9AGAM|nr:hypothetical protein OE88DRAFT_1720946 [Heliocybe sulcata]
MAPPAPAPPPPSLQEATRKATVAWQDDLQSLFNHAKDRFPDVVWELYPDEDDKGKGGDEVWGHKAIVYARAPPSFQARYFSFKSPAISSPTPYSPSPATLAGQSSLSLGLDLTPSRSPSPFRGPSPSPSGAPNALLRIPTYINPILFSNELEYLYTGKGLGEAFEFLFDSTESREEGDSDESRTDKLRKDLVFMWRSRLYSDVRITLEGNFSSTNHESATAIFSSHRFILVSRSPYFRTRLLTWPGALAKSNEPQTLSLPSPPFTPASLFFTLGFMYAGTLIFSHRTFDLDTAFHIMRSATYLSVDTLYDEIQARIVQEMMHGLFHAFLEFSEYERITGGKWGIGGCRCRQCARRAPRVLEFASQDDVKNQHLDRGARRALVGLFGEGWATPEFSKLPQKVRDSLLKGLAKRTTPMNIFALIFSAGHGMEKLKNVIEAWADTSRDMIVAARRLMDQVLCDQVEECFEQPEWLEVMEGDGVGFDDADRVAMVMEAVLRGLSEKNAAMVYQTLVSSILLRPHATETDQTMLSSTSHVRVQVEDTRVDVLRWLRKKWMGVRQTGGFDKLEGWALKEISGGVHDKTKSVASTSSGATVQGALKRKNSNDTIKETAKRAGKQNGSALPESRLKTPRLDESLPLSPRGATLDIGIACVISSKRARFKAFARYIGEVEGEAGPWVGVEVPVDDTWPDEKLEGRQWNDGSWGGIRYFQLGSGSEFDYGDGRAVRRRKFDWASQKDRGVKREGDQLSMDRVKRFRSASPTASDVSTSESRGLFVRPQQVLYVVDAVGMDL